MDSSRDQSRSLTTALELGDKKAIQEILNAVEDGNNFWSKKADLASILGPVVLQNRDDRRFATANDIPEITTHVEENDKVGETKFAQIEICRVDNTLRKQCSKVFYFDPSPFGAVESFVTRPDDFSRAVERGDSLGVTSIMQNIRPIDWPVALAAMKESNNNRLTQSSENHVSIPSVRYQFEMTPRDLLATIYMRDKDKDERRVATITTDRLDTLKAKDEKTNQSISAKGVDQKIFGDCSFEATLASVSETRHGKMLISKMIKSNNDGSYTVKFPGAPDQTALVTPVDLALTPSSNSSQWADLAETAAEKLRPAEIKNGMAISEALYMITGKSSQSLHITDGILSSPLLKITNGAIEAVLEKANHDIPVVAATNLERGASFFSKIFNSGLYYLAGINTLDAGNRLYSNHAYSILSYDKIAKTVNIRDPHGVNNYDQSKIFPQDNRNLEQTITLQEFKKDFGYIYYSIL